MIRIMLVAGAMATASISGAETGARDEPPASAYAPYLHSRLAEGVHLLAVRAGYGGFATSNIVVVEQATGFVVFDTGVLYGDGERIVSLVRSLGDKPVSHIVYSHWHNDHVEGAAAILKVWPDALVVASEATRDGLDGPVTRYGPGYDRDLEWERNFAAQLEQTVSAIKTRAAAEEEGERRAQLEVTAREIGERIADIPNTVQVRPGLIVSDVLVLDDPERPVELRFLGKANTPGDIVAWMPRQKIVAAGDIVVSPVPFGFYSYPSQWMATLAALRELEFDLLVPGHGMPQDNAAYIDRLSAAIADLRNQIAPLASAGLGVDEIRARLDLTRQREWFGTGSKRSAELENYWLRPMVDNVWREAMGFEIQQGEGETP